MLEDLREEHGLKVKVVMYALGNCRGRGGGMCRTLSYGFINLFRFV